MEYINYNEQFWQPDVLKRRDRTVDTVRKYGHLVYIANKGYTEDILPEKHPLNIKLKTCTNDEEYLQLKLTAAEAAWLVCYSLSDEYIKTLLSGNDFIYTDAHSAISRASNNNPYKDIDNLRIEKPVSDYFIHNDITIMDIALKMDELILNDWKKSILTKEEKISARIAAFDLIINDVDKL